MWRETSADAFSRDSCNGRSCHWLWCLYLVAFHSRGLTSHVVTFGRCSFHWALKARLLHFISPWLESWPENNSASITICCDCGFGATLQHLRYTGIWGTLKMNSPPTPVCIPRLHLVNRCSELHCSPIARSGLTPWLLSVKLLYTHCLFIKE